MLVTMVLSRNIVVAGSKWSLGQISQIDYRDGLFPKVLLNLRKHRYSTVSDQQQPQNIRNNDQELFLHPDKWRKLSPQKIIELYWERKTKLGSNYEGTRDELEALLSTSDYSGVSRNDIKRFFESNNTMSNKRRTKKGNNPGKISTPATKYSKADLKYGLRPFQFDDLPSPAQDELENIRGERFYKRLAAFELPLLVQLRQEYKPVPRETHPISYKYTSYLGEDHPNSKKVVLRCKTKHLGLNEKQLHKFRLLARTRYDYETDYFKMSSEKFEESAQNARYLHDIFQKLIAESKDLTSDNFSDIPLDKRHITAKNLRKRKTIKYEFPKEWNRPEDAPVKRVNLLKEILSN